MNIAEKVNHIVNNYQVNPFFARRIAESVNDFSDEILTSYIRSKPKPFVKWVGGKRQLIAQFQELGALSPLDFDQSKHTYFEPFVGGGAVFFELLPLRASINDINEELVTTYNVIRDNVERLIEELTNGQYQYNKEVFLDIRSWDTTKISDLRRAARFIYLNRTGFNGMYRVNKSGQFNVPFGRYNNPQICDAENLRRVANVLINTQITSKSYKYVLDEAKAGDFIYFDPPYYPVSKTASFTSYSNDVFLEREQEQLRDTFVELHKRGCFVMLSNSSTPFIESLFAPYQKNGITIHRVEAGRNINSKVSGRGKVFEMLVMNF